MARALNNTESHHWEVTNILLLSCLVMPRRKVSQYGANISLFSIISLPPFLIKGEWVLDLDPSAATST